MTQINDQAMPELAEDFGAAIQVASGVVNPNIQAIAKIEQYRRVMRSAREVTITNGITTSIAYNFVNGKEETRRFFMVRFVPGVAATIRVIGTIQRESSGQLFKEVFQVTVANLVSTRVVGKGQRENMTASLGLFFPDEVIQPPDSTFVIKVTKDGGGAIAVGAVTMEASYWREPPLRRWGTGPPTSVVQA